MFATKAVLDGLKTLAAHAGAGGAEDLEIDEGQAAGRKRWAAVQAACDWALGLKPGREILIRLTPAEAESLARGDKTRASERALEKLMAARLAFEDDRIGRRPMVAEPEAPDISRRRFGRRYP